MGISASAIYAENSAVTIVYSGFLYNGVQDYGGAVYATTSEVVIAETGFYNNYGSLGAAVTIDNSVVTISNTEFDANAAAEGTLSYVSISQFQELLISCSQR